MRSRALACLTVAVAVSAGGCRCGSERGASASYGEARLFGDEAGQAGDGAAVDFGVLSMGKRSRRVLRVQNVGRGRLPLLGLEVEPGAPVRVVGAEVGVTDEVAAGDGGQTPEATAFTVVLARDTEVATGETLELPVYFHPPLDTSATKVDWAARLVLRTGNAPPGLEATPVRLRGTAVSGVCELPELIEFGAVAVGTATEAEFVLRNEQLLEASAFVGELVSAQGETAFAYSADSPRGEFRLAPGQQRRVVVRFSPTAAHASTATATLRAAEGCPPVTLRVRGTGVDRVLTWLPDVLDFGYVAPGAVETATIALANLALEPVQLSELGAFEGGLPTSVFEVGAASLAGREAVVVPGATLGEGGSIVAGEAALEVAFRPKALGTRRGELRARTSLPGQPAFVVPMKGVGGGPSIEVRPSPLVSFGRVAYFESAATPAFAARRAVVQNVGVRPLSPDPRANLRLGAEGVGPPYVRIDPQGPGTLASELCVGSFDEARGGCLGGLAPTYDPLLGLEAGGARSILEVPLRVTPTSAGEKAWSVTFLSNDPQRPEVSVRMTANAVALPPCALRVSPGQLGFGVVSPPATKELSVELTNLGAGPGDHCLVTNLELAEGTDPLFTLPQGPLPERLLGPGETLRVAVRAWPQGPLPTAPKASTGELRFQVSSPDAPTQRVRLTATVAPSCLTIAPSSLDFGTVQRGCNSPDRSFQLYNTCATNLRLESAGVSLGAGFPAGTPECSGSTACPEFVTVSAPPAMELPPGAAAPASFVVKYRPLDLGVDQGALVLRVVQGGQALDYVVPLKGRGDTAGSNVDTFLQELKPKADILLVIDDSGSMADKQEALARNFRSFIKYAQTSRIDFQIGVTSTDMSAAKGGGKLVASPSGERIFKSATTPEGEAQLESQFQAAVKLGTSGSSEETCLSPAVAALTAPLITDPAANLGLLRHDAVLAVVCVTDAEEQAKQPVSYYLNQLLNIKGAQRPGAFTYNVIGPFGTPTPSCEHDPSSDPTRHLDVVAKTNGLKADICTSDWAKALEDIGKGAFGYRTNFYLTARPDTQTGSAVVVELNGRVLLPEEAERQVQVWAYEAATNSIKFEPLYVPQAGDTLTVKYQVACLP